MHSFLLILYKGKNYLSILSKEKYKLIIVTSPPLNLIRLAYDLNKKFNIPFVVDFQDSWNNLMLAENYNPKIKEKFYNYFESNGWLVGGRSKMKNWKAAANNWMLNSKKFNPVEKENHYQTNENKDYNIPL